MPKGISLFVLLTLAAFVTAAVVRQRDGAADKAAWSALVANDDSSRASFDPSKLRDLPEPAQRYFRYVITPGTPLKSRVELRMSGRLDLGTKANPNQKDIAVHQLLAPPEGLVWMLDASGLSGSDALTPETSWSRFWLFGVAPLVRQGGDDDHRKSAFGRVVIEAAVWAPASLLPSDNIRWMPLGPDSARVTVQHGGLTQAVDITVSPEGRPTEVVTQRWGQAVGEEAFSAKPFGGKLSAFKDFDGYRLPTDVEVGYQFGTSDYFPFLTATVSSVTFPDGS